MNSSPARGPDDDAVDRPPVLMPEQGEPVAHYVTDDEMSAPLRGSDPRALCGRTFRPAGLTAPIDWLCPACRDVVRSAAQPRRRGRRGLHRRSR